MSVPLHFKQLFNKFPRIWGKNLLLINVKLVIFQEVSSVMINSEK